MDIKTAKADLTKRQAAVVDELNQIAAQEQQSAVRKQELIVKAHQLNGEAEMLKRLGKNDDKTKKS